MNHAIEILEKEKLYLEKKISEVILPKYQAILKLKLTEVENAIERLTPIDWDELTTSIKQASDTLSNLI